MTNKIINCLNFAMDSSTKKLLTLKIQMAIEENPKISAEEIFNKLEIKCPEETKICFIESIEDILNKGK